MDNEEQLKALLHKYLKDTCTDDERALVEAWYTAMAREAHQRGDTAHLLDDAAADGNLTRIKDEAFRYIQENKSHRPKQGRVLYLKIAAAAALILCGTWVWFYMQRTATLTPHEQASVVQDIAPGRDAAFLTLSNGDTVNLSGPRKGITMQNGLTYSDGTPVLPAPAIAELAWLELTTPRGGTYQLTLPDGTEVWLNAATTLRYPVVFGAEERRVTLSGEAYFHVRPQSMGSDTTHKPFLVQTPRQQIRVLGTQFNVNDYDDEPMGTTTLVEGKVAVHSNDGGGRGVTLLRGGQQSIVADGVMRTAQVNAQEATGWRHGVIALNHVAFGPLIRQLERWYDVDFDFEDRPRQDIVLSGTLPRDSRLSGILNALAVNTGLTYTISGRKVVVTKHQAGHSNK